MRFESAHYQHLELQGSWADSRRGRKGPWEDRRMRQSHCKEQMGGPGIDITFREQCYSWLTERQAHRVVSCFL
ncbi:hypothetical protein NQZ68_025738 [Dissostichus eleginoides]|nr:hypothetical protein NQZ68_025738 [Dissostichus eleginoides]